MSVDIEDATASVVDETADRVFVAGAGRTRISVRSIWFLLLYSSEYLDRITGEEKERIVSGERDNDLLDALADVLAAQVEARVRSMLARGYRARTEPLTRVRGRIDHLGTARGRLLESGRILCRYEEQTADLPRYRFMLVALRQAGRSASSVRVRSRCLTVAQMLEHMGVAYVDPVATELAKEQYGYFDQRDRKLVALSRLVRDMCAPEHAPGTNELPAIMRDEHALRKLFESAVRSFYQHHLSSRGMEVRARSEKWPAEGADADLSYLPRSNADVVISGDGKQSVVECKFGPIFGTGAWGNKVMINPGYLRQLMTYAYTFGYEVNGTTSAVLLGALVQDSKGRDLDLVIGDFPVRIRQVDLSAPPSEVREVLLSAVVE